MKKKISSEKKYEAVKLCLAGKLSQRRAAEIYGVHPSSVQSWIRLYEAEGIGAFTRTEPRTYDAKMKRNAVKAYLSGKGSLQDICKKYLIRSTALLLDWIKVYHVHGDFNSKISGGNYMRKGRKTTQEEREQIVRDCLASGKDYGATAIKYNVSYRQIWNWTKSYEKLGPAGMEDRRGKRKISQTPRSEVERLQQEKEELKRKLYYAEMERDLLKKLEEIERRDASHK